MKRLFFLIFHTKTYRKVEMIAMQDCVYLLAPLDPIGYDIKRQILVNEIRYSKDLQWLHTKLLKKSLSNWAFDVNIANRLLKGRVANPTPPRTDFGRLPQLA